MFETRDDNCLKQNEAMSVGSGPVITGVHTALIDVPLRQRTITDSQSSVESVEFLQITIETDAGVTGYGFNWNYTRGLRSVQVMVDDCFAPVVLGRSAFDRSAAHQAMHATSHFIGRVGVAQVGLCAMNLALWDVQLKAEEQPLWRFLGPVRDRVKAYNTDGGWLT
jgi:L-alanine-DL-glutamate epimerase-like enolase superfamily enzyme